MVQVLIHCFDDADFLAGALASIPDAWPVHVVDGRYATFAGERELTPAAATVCEDAPNTWYHAPPSDRLPWGHEYDDGTDRWPQYCEMQYSATEILVPSVWTLKLDADERLETFDVAVDDLDRDTKVHASVRLEDNPSEDITGEFAYIPRLFVPERWTFWTDDAFVPRDEVARDAGAPAVKAAVARGQNLTNVDLTHRDDIVIDNVGHRRPDDYHERRADQLDAMYPYEIDAAQAPAPD